MRVVVLCLAALLSAFFSGAETSLFSLRPEDFQGKAGSTAAARIISELKKRPDQLITTIVLYNTVANLLFFSVSYLLLYMYRHAMPAALPPLLGAGSLLFVILFCEVIPKNLAVLYARPFAAAAAYPIYGLQKILQPVLTPLEKLVAGCFATALKALPDRPALSGEELQMLIELSEKEGVVEEDVGLMMAEVLELSGIAVREIAVPRVDMVCFPVDSTPEKIEKLFRESKHTLLPVYEERMDNMLGVVHLRDFLFRGEGVRIKDLIRKIPFLPESASAENALRLMRTGQSRMVFVVDEYGAVEGLVTIEDIVEEIVGSIGDEYDAAEHPPVQKLDDSLYRLRGDLSIREWQEALAVEIGLESPADTVGGLVMALLGKIPAAGDSVTYNNLHFKVESMQGRRIKYIRLTLQKPEK